ncbi:MAG: hypothetical protein JXQ99_22945 [Hyphomicrobiaceae bacterium]
MQFDSKTRELARAHDAVDRLQEIKNSMEERAEAREKLHDQIVRGVLLMMIVVVVLIAIWKL